MARAIGNFPDVCCKALESSQGDNMSKAASKLNHAKVRCVGHRFSRDKIIQASILTVFAAMLVMPFSGCASGLRIPRLGFGDALLEKYRDNVWAKRAFNLRYANCDIPYAEHFENGFVAGYCQKCNGGDGYVPPLPPDQYRGYEFQSADGAQCVKAWFDGFPAGVAAAKKDRAGDFHDIYTSKMVNSAIIQGTAKHVLPDDVPVLKGSVKKAEMQANSQLVSPTSPSQIYREAKLSPVDITPNGTLSPTYVAPPTLSPNPILKPNSIMPSDLMPAPKINKVGPSAMKRASSRFAIDPAVSVAGSLTRDNSNTTIAKTLPPIVTAVNPPVPPVESFVNQAKESLQRPQVAKRVGETINRTPLPLSVGKPSWETNSPAIRR
jgi:hypothetical protein